MNKIKITIFIGLMPILFIAFLLDRSISLLLPHMTHVKFSEWIRPKVFTYGLLRIGAMTLLYFLIKLIF